MTVNLHHASYLLTCGLPDSSHCQSLLCNFIQMSLRYRSGLGGHTDKINEDNLKLEISRSVKIKRKILSPIGGS